MSKKILITLLALAFMAMSTFAFAASFTVYPTVAASATNYTTIQAAINAAPVGTTITCAGGSYAENITIGTAELTINCSSADSMVTITGGVAGDVITLTAGGSSATALTTFTNVAVDISANGAKVAANRLLKVATAQNFVKLYNCSFTGKAATTLELVEFVGAANNWQIENCTFNNAIGNSVALNFTGTGGTNVNTFNILGSTFNGLASGAIVDPDGAGPLVADAKAIFVSDITGVFTNIYVGGNTFAKEGIVLNFDDATAAAGLPAYSNVRIYDNIFTQCNAFLMQGTVANVLTLGDGTGTTPAWTAGQLLIKGNKFGSLTTEGDTFFAIMFNGLNGLTFNEDNVFINNNNFQYPMTNGTDTNTWGGHVTANKLAGSDLAGINAKDNFWGQITGPLTAYESKGIAVVKTAGSPFDYSNWISSYSVPQVDETNHGITIFDYDGNGHIDRAVVWFDQYVDPSTISSYAAWSISGGYLFATTKAPKLSLDNDHEGTADGVFCLTLYIKESSSFDTGVTPQITYSKALGGITGITGASGAKVNDILDATATERDKAKPVIKSIVTKDTGVGTGVAPTAANKANNGKIDGVVVTFSETVTLGATRTAGTDADWANAITSVGAYGLGTITSSSDAVTVPLVEVGYDSNTKPAVVFPIVNTVDDIVDGSGNYLTTTTAGQTYTATVDGAAPVAYIVETGDYGSANGGTGVADGYIDGYKITFSEPIAAIDAADSLKVSGAFAVQEVTAGVVENTMDLSTAKLTVGASTLTVKGRSLKDASAVGHPWDTDKKPALTYTSQGAVKDAAGNAWVYFWKPIAAAANVKMTEVDDKALPIIARATGQVNSKNLYVTFSEPSTGNGGGGAFASADLQYHNIYTTGLNASQINSLSDADGTDATATIVATTNENFLVQDVVNDSLSIAAAVLDVPGNAMLDVIVTINDVIAPTLLSATTNDYDNDGWVDTIKLTFSENINDAALTGYNGGAKLSTNAAVNWAVAGYTVVGLNFISDATEQTTATTDAIARGLVGVYDDFGAYAGGLYSKKVVAPSPFDTANDNILYLAVEEGSSSDKTFGDTNATPAITVTGDTAASVSDFKPNYLATVTKTTADNAGAAVMAAEFRSANDLRVWLSEAVADTVVLGAGGMGVDQLVSGDFSIEVGTVGNTIGTTAKDVTQSSPGIVDLYFMSAVTTADNGGWIGLSGVGTLNDNSGYASTQVLASAIGRKVITPWDGSGTVGPITGPLAPASALTVTDVAGDNGHWFMAKFKVSSDTRVKSYQFYRQSISGTDTTWIYTAIVPKGYIKADSTFAAYVPTPINGSLKWAVVASSGDAISDLVAAKEGDIAIAQLAPVAKVSEEILTSGLSNVATGGAIDNIAPSALTVYGASDNAGAGTGILVSWTAPADHNIVGSYGSGTYSFPIYGVSEYQIFRRTGSEVFTLIGSAPAGSTSYVDNVADGTTVYTYRIKPTDGTFTSQTGNSFAMANANANVADFSSDGTVDFTDFTMFASVYGSAKTNPVGTWVSLYDLAPNGTVDFDDFTAFAANYGFGATKAAKEIAGVQLPVSNIAFTMDAKVDEATSMYYVNVNIADFAKINGFEFKLAYDSSALELVKESTNGLNGLTIQNNKDGVVEIANMFNNELFNGTVTLGFKSNGNTSNYVFELTNALVSDKESGISQVTKLSSVTAKALPQVYSLSKNYPNPFNPTTTIEYAIPSNGKVELVVYNMAGQKVRTMVNETKEAGFFKAVWDGRNDRGETVASGLYFYKLVSGKFNKIEKMTLVK